MRHVNERPYRQPTHSPLRMSQHQEQRSAKLTRTDVCILALWVLIVGLSVSMLLLEVANG